MGISKKIKIISTNWVNIVVVFLIVYLYSFFLNYFETSYNVFQALFAALLLVGLYGIIFWVGLILAFIILDIVCITDNLNTLKTRLLLEWAIVSSIFLYGVIKYQEWIFLVGIIALLISQLLRQHRIKSVLSL
jgi:hypothetical protein